MATHTLFSKICVVGDGAVGKTAMLHSYCNHTFPSGYEPTIFDNYSVCIMLGDGRPLQLGLWDTAGQEDYDRLRPLSYPLTDCFLICYSVVNPESWQNAISKWLPEVRHHCPGAKVVFVGTKSDLLHSPTTLAKLQGKVVDDEDVQSTASRLGFPTVRCSALTQKGLKNVFDTAIRGIHAPRPPPPVKQSFVARLLKQLPLLRGAASESACVEADYVDKGKRGCNHGANQKAKQPIRRLAAIR